MPSGSFPAALVSLEAILQLRQ